MRTRSSLRTWCRAAIAVGLIGAATAARAQEQIEYYGTDVLGSIRIVFDAAGTVKGRMDFAPFGGSVQTGSGVSDKVFAQLSFDGETGLDYAQARMYEATTGRFYAPDPLYAGLFAPQGWNRYAYALNNPVRFADPSGLEVGPCNPPRPNCWASGNDPGGNDPGVSPPSESPSEGTSDFFLRDELCWTWHLCGADPSTYSFGGVFGGIAGLPGLPEVPPPQAPPPQAPPLVHPLPPNTPKSDEKAFNSAYSNAYQRLQSSRCGNLYGGSGIATQTMSNIMYRFQNLGSASYQGGRLRCLGR